jgi:hypothetical protein
MSKIFRVLLILALVAAGIGYFRSWYTVTRVDVEQQTNINVQINRQRIREDVDRATEKVRQITGQSPSGNGEQPPPDASGLTLPWRR